MVAQPRSRSAEIRAGLDHPIIDCDGHMVEFQPAVQDYIKQAMGGDLYETFQQRPDGRPQTLEEKQHQRYFQRAWWGAGPSTKPYDMASAALPKLLRHRMDDMGVDFSILYTSVGLGTILDQRDEIRQTFCHGVNEFFAEYYSEFSDRLTCAGLVPLHTPEEGIRELEHCKELGLKVVMIPHGIPRPIPAEDPALFPRLHWLDTFGLDSIYDYDPFWQRLQDLGYAATFHTIQEHATNSITSRSITSYMYNHIGSHALLMQQSAKSIFMGGVTRRFPDLQFAFLECGVYWAAGMLTDLVEHWHRRNGKAIRQYDPANIDRELMLQLHEEWGGKLTEPYMEQYKEQLARITEGGIYNANLPDELDEFIHIQAETEEEVAGLFENFHFGCESDDQTAHTAFHGNAFDQRLKAMFSTDIGHWDVEDFERCVSDSYRLVEDELLASEDYRAFMADNPIRLHGRMNPDFWKDTVVAGYADRLLNGDGG